MKYLIQNWKIADLLKAYKDKLLNLNPSYQRNDIWTEKAQRELISTIRDGMPIPNFFFHEKQNKKYDIADGQQRTRAILAFVTGEIKDVDGNLYNENDKEFLSYELAIIVIDKSVTQDQIRKFYVKVNNTGLRLNSPELTKSQYYNSKILKLVEDLAQHEAIQSFGLFSTKQEDRMIDREFMEELVSQILYGITDKKLAIKKLYEENTQISEKTLDDIRKSFEKIIKVLEKINKSIPINSTRYSQKNDFYTLFGLIKDNPQKQIGYNAVFDFLVHIQDDISPSNEKCTLLQEYAFNCITQSHGKSARERRYQILSSLCFNKYSKLTEEQLQLIDYYGLKKKDYVEVDGLLLLDASKIKTKFSE